MTHTAAQIKLSIIDFQTHPRTIVHCIDIAVMCFVFVCVFAWSDCQLSRQMSVAAHNLLQLHWLLLLLLHINVQIVRCECVSRNTQKPQQQQQQWQKFQLTFACNAGDRQE